MKKIKYKAWDKFNSRIIDIPEFDVICISPDLDFENYELLEFTGFKDKNGNEIFEGFILSDYTKTDEGIIKSHCQVFWNEPTGSWHLDESYHQDKTSSRELWLELNDFDYEITGNIYENRS